jgi:hypothetical protein
MNPLAMWKAWLALSLQSIRLGWEAQNVVALRLMRFGLDSSHGRSEAQRMVLEKFATMVEAQGAATTAAIMGAKPHRIAKRVIGEYRKRVRNNRRRLAT